MFIPIGWNDSVAAAFAGSAIYLHIAREDFTPTAGCVVIAHDRVLELARRMQPGMMIDIALAGAKSNTLAAPELRTASAIEIVSFRGMEKGPKIIVTGAVHGDEPAGPRAITRLISEIRSGAINLLNGSITFVPVINSLAWRRASREGDRNLNRYLSEKVISHDNEDRVGNILCPLLREHDVLIDLHSFAGAGDPMVLVGPSNNRGHGEPF